LQKYQKIVNTGGKLVEKNAIILFAGGDQPTLHNGNLEFLKNKRFLHKMVLTQFWDDTNKNFENRFIFVFYKVLKRKNISKKRRGSHLEFF
jgi:hypothetical protein